MVKSYERNKKFKNLKKSFQISLCGIFKALKKDRNKSLPTQTLPLIFFTLISNKIWTTGSKKEPYQLKICFHSFASGKHARFSRLDSCQLFDPNFCRFNDYCVSLYNWIHTQEEIYLLETTWGCTNQPSILAKLFSKRETNSFGI